MAMTTPNSYIWKKVKLIQALIIKAIITFITLADFTKFYFWNETWHANTKWKIVNYSWLLSCLVIDCLQTCNLNCKSEVKANIHPEFTPMFVKDRLVGALLYFLLTNKIISIKYFMELSKSSFHCDYIWVF